MAPVLAQRLAVYVTLVAPLSVADDFLVQILIAIDEPSLQHPSARAVLQLLTRLQLEHRLPAARLLALQADELSHPNVLCKADLRDLRVLSTADRAKSPLVLRVVVEPDLRLGHLPIARGAANRGSVLIASVGHSLAILHALELHSTPEAAQVDWLTVNEITCRSSL
jgi:hypothetical protein